jgi:3-hydroxyacyl-CoA dehydrogenase/3-hydroxy-2-methylbutyryl-CoA dehydrogenase
VAVLDVPASRGADVADQLGEGHVFVAADVTDTGQVEAAVESAASSLGGLDVCVNAAGVGSAARVVSRSGDLFPLDLFRFVVEVNLIGTFDVLRRAARVMSANQPNDDGERGVIVNVASIAAFEGQVGQAAYSASKGGVAAMTLPLARDLAALGIRVVCIAPGIMDTPMIASMPEELREALTRVHVFPKRLGKPEDFASLVQAMVENPLLNGEVVRLDAAARMGPR